MAGGVGGGVALTSGDGEEKKGAEAGAPFPTATGPVIPDVPAPSSPPSVKPTEPPRTLKLPKSVAGYRQENGSAARRLVAEMRRDMAKSDGPLGKRTAKAAKAALYSDGGGNTVVFVGYQLSALSLTGEDVPENPSSIVDGVLLGSNVSNDRRYPAGRLGGVLRCGKGGDKSGFSASVCAWADSSVLGMVLAPDLTPKRLATFTLKFRNAAER